MLFINCTPFERTCVGREKLITDYVRLSMATEASVLARKKKRNNIAVLGNSVTW